MAMDRPNVAHSVYDNMKHFGSAAVNVGTTYYDKLMLFVFKPYRRLWLAIYAFLAFALPLWFVHYVLVTTYLRSDYMYHTQIRPSQVDMPRKFIGRNHNLHLQRDWNYTQLSQNRRLFQNITADGQSLVFSAYLDDTKNAYKIRAIGVKDRRYVNATFCVVWYKDYTESTLYEDSYGYVVVPGYIDEHPEIFERSWSQVHFMCPLLSLPTNPHAVSIVTQYQAEPVNLIEITYPEDDPLRSYTICLHSAFNFRNDMSRDIVEWIEMNRILGADHFVMYNFSSHPKNDEVLRWYAHRGIVTLVQWDLPVYTDVHVIAQVAAMTDCLFRNYYSAKFIAHLDLDEYIVPRRPGVTTVPELLSVIPEYCAYIARCSVFSVADGYDDSPFKGKESAEKFKLNTLLVRKRQSFIWWSRDRSKIILRTSCISAAGIHLIQSYASGIRSETTFEITDALMHHYRNGRPKFSKIGDKVQDNFMLKFAPKLISNVEKSWDLIKENTEINKLEQYKTNTLILV